MADNRKDCCKIESNLIPEETGKEDLSMRRCKVCKCRHFELNVDPIKLIQTGIQIGS